MENSKFVELGKTVTNTVQAQFNRNEFEKLIYEKGYNVIHEKCLICPCKSTSTNQLSNCKNCGGSGFLFINPRSSRMVITSISIENDFKPWSQEAAGTINITAAPEDELSIWDRITIVDGISIFTESVNFFIDILDNKLKGILSYSPKEISYIGLFINVNTPLKRLFPIVDYVVENYTIKLNDSYLNDFNEDDPYNITIRYKHSPVYNILEMRKEMMISRIGVYSSEKEIYLPVSAMARRSHYIERLKGLGNIQNLLDNNYSDLPYC